MIEYVDLALNYANDLFMLGLLVGVTAFALLVLPVVSIKGRRRIKALKMQHSQDVTESEARVETKELELQNLRQQYEEQTAQLEKQREENEDLKREFDAERTWRLSVEEQLVEERERANGLGRQIDDLSQMLQQLRHEKDRLRQETERARHELESVKREKETLQLVLEEKRARDAEHNEFLSLAKEEFKKSFASLSSAALKYNNEKFVALATQVLDEKIERGDEQMVERQKQVGLVEESFRSLVTEVERRIETLEAQRVTQQSALEEGLRLVLSSSNHLSDEASRLRGALSGSRGRMHWGRERLTDLLHISGISNFIYADTPSRELLLELPNGKTICIFSDAPTPSVKEGEEVSGEEYSRHLEEYITTRSVPCGERVLSEAVIFIPAEGFLRAAVEHSPEIIKLAYSKRLILTTPTTLLGFLSIVTAGWRESELQKRSEEIVALGRELCHRIAAMNQRFESLGSNLTAAVREYNDTSLTIRGRVLPVAQRIEGLCGTSFVAETPPLAESPLVIVETELVDVRALLSHETSDSEQEKHDRIAEEL